MSPDRQEELPASSHTEPTSADATEPSAPSPDLDDPSRPEAPEPAESGANDVLEHPHWATPLVRGWLLLVAAAVFVAREASQQLDQHEPLDMGFLGFIGALVGALLVIQLVIGFLEQRTTTFRIDDEEVRIDHRLVWHRSDRLALGKVQSVDVHQPFAARILGLARLTIDVGAGEHKTIEYLTRADAYRFRDLLIARARSDGSPLDHARPGKAETSGSAAGPTGGGSRWYDRRRDDEMVTTVSSRQVVVGTVASLTFLLAVLGILATTVISVVTGEMAIGFTAFLGVALGVGGYVWNSLSTNWRFTLMRSGGNLKAVHGMTSLTTRTVPVHRIQGIEISQPLLWRPLGLHRVEYTVLGFDLAEAGEGTVLLPMGDADQVEAALAAVWPRLDLDSVPTKGVPERARRFRWFDRKTLRWGWDDEVLVSRRGLLTRSTSIVPHARVQSVAVTQGPLQRRLGLADVHAEIPAGTVALVCQHLDHHDARGLVVSEMDRCRAARRAELAGRRLTDPAPEQAEPVTPADPVAPAEHADPLG